MSIVVKPELIMIWLDQNYQQEICYFQSTRESFACSFACIFLKPLQLPKIIYLQVYIVQIIITFILSSIDQYIEQEKKLKKKYDQSDFLRPQLINKILAVTPILKQHTIQCVFSLDHYNKEMTEQANQKLIEIVQKKLSSEENILSIIRTIYFFPIKNPNNKKIEDSLIITTINMYFIQGSQIKRILPIKQISYISLAILGKEFILHCDKEWMRLQSGEIISILGNILHARERFLFEKSKFTICLQIQRTLQALNSSEVQKKSIFSIFKKIDKKQLTASGRRVSFCTIEVNERNFMLEIGKKCYKAIFQNAQLLHISGNAEGFRFDAQNYQYRDLSKDDTLYWRFINEQNNSNNNNIGKKKQYLRRKIAKDSSLETQLIHRALSTYKYNNYNEDIIYALQLDTHFQIITQVLDKWTYCWQYLIHHNNYDRSLINGNSELEQQRLLTQMELRSIFYKLHDFIDQQSEKYHILSSLSLDYVYISDGDVRVSTIFCKIFSKINISYIAPEEFKTLDRRLAKYNEVPLSKTFSQENHINTKGSFQQVNSTTQSMVMTNYRRTEQESKTIDGEHFSSMEIYKINLWKLGMLLYQLAYHKLPFPIEYVAYKTQHHEHIKIHFPERDSYSIEFHHFIKSLICKDPVIRGMRTKGDVRMSVMNPQIANVMSHQWILKGKK